MPAQYMQAMYYRASDGSQPVKDYLDAFTAKERVILLGQIDMLNRLTITSPPLEYPQSSQVDGPLRELRCHLGGDRHRIYYQRSENFFILLHAIPKNTKKLPPSETVVAKVRWEDFKERMNAKPRTPPRPVGNDAPPPSFTQARKQQN